MKCSKKRRCSVTPGIHHRAEKKADFEICPSKKGGWKRAYSGIDSRFISEAESARDSVARHSTPSKYELTPDFVNAWKRLDGDIWQDLIELKVLRHAEYLNEIRAEGFENLPHRNAELKKFTALLLDYIRRVKTQEALTCNFRAMGRAAYSNIIKWKAEKINGFKYQKNLLARLQINYRARWSFVLKTLLSSFELLGQ